MILRDGYRSNLPHKSSSHQQINTARLRNQNKKTDRENVYNSCHLTKDFSFKIGDCVLVRNYKRRSKFEPYFLPDKFHVTDILANGNTLLIENTVSGLGLQRHLIISNCLMAHYPPYLSRPSKMTILHMTKICTGEMLLILLPKVSTLIMTNPFKRQILARFP